MGLHLVQRLFFFFFSRFNFVIKLLLQVPIVFGILKLFFISFDFMLIHLLDLELAYFECPILPGLLALLELQSNILLLLLKLLLDTLVELINWFVLERAASMRMSWHF